VEIRDLSEHSEFLKQNSHILGRMSFYAMYKGHGGSKTCKYLSGNLHNLFIQEFIKNGVNDILTDKNIKDAFKSSFKIADKNISDLNYQDGACAAVAIRIGNTMYLANIGNVRSYLCRASDEQERIADSSKHYKMIPLSEDHKVYVIKERDRIERKNGVIKNGKVNGILDVTRTFGDTSFKKVGVSCRPQVKKFTWGEQDKFILFISEPMWNSIEVEKILEELYKHTTPKKDVNSVQAMKDLIRPLIDSEKIEFVFES